MGKYQVISALAEETVKEIVKKEEDWKRFLTTASRLYKYPFWDQILIFAQRPEATACASLELWNEKMHCWVNKGARGIALIDDQDQSYGKLRYVFDIRDVHKAKRIGRLPYLWEMKEEWEEKVLTSLENIYGKTDQETDFIHRIRELSVRITEECVPDLIQELQCLKEGSFLEALDEYHLSIRLRITLADSIAYAVLRRCGIPEEILKEGMRFPYIHEFNTVETLSHLGNYVSDLVKPILMEIGASIRREEKETNHSLEERCV